MILVSVPLPVMKQQPSKFNLKRLNIFLNLEYQLSEKYRNYEFAKFPNDILIMFICLYQFTIKITYLN